MCRGNASFHSLANFTPLQQHPFLPGSSAGYVGGVFRGAESGCSTNLNDGRVDGIRAEKACDVHPSIAVALAFSRPLTKTTHIYRLAPTHIASTTHIHTLTKAHTNQRWVFYDLIRHQASRNLWLPSRCFKLNQTQRCSITHL